MSDLELFDAPDRSEDQDGRSAFYRANLEVLREVAPGLADQVAGIENSGSQLVGSRETGDLNIDLGHSAFYDGGAVDYCARHVESFLAEPKRIKLGWYVRPEQSQLSSKRLIHRGLDAIEEQGIRRAKQLDRDGGYLIVMGLGLGLHIQPMLEELPVRNLVIVEQFPEFVNHALEASDWTAWRDILAERGGEIHVITAADQFLAANSLYVYLRRHDFGLIDGSYMAVHYQSSFNKAVLEEINSRLPVIAANPGFFEDEIVMLRNCFRNLRWHEHSLLQDKSRLALRTPVIVVASGPSLDSAIDFVRENREKAIVITCGTGLSALLGYGIKPDFHVDTENTPGPLEILSDLGQDHDLSGITLISCNTVDPGVPALFDRRYFYFRDSVSASHYFGRDHRPLYLAAPTVANAAVRAMLTVGFREIYLVGVDLGSRDKGRHHSEKSVYIADEKFLETHPEHKAATKYPLPRQGSLGGTVFANSSFLYAAMFMANLMRMFPVAKVYNLGDGTRISGTIPRLPRAAKIDNDPALKQRELDIAHSSLDDGGPYKGFDATELERLAETMRDATRDVAAAFRAHDDPVELFDALRDIFVGLGDGAVGATVHSYLYGTVLMFHQFVYVSVRRIEPEDRPAFLKAATEIAAEEAEGLHATFRELIDELLAELEPV